MELSNITYEIQPTIWLSPDYDSYDAYSEVFFAMGSLLEKLDIFLKNYNYIMPQEIIISVNKVMDECNKKHWDYSPTGNTEYEPTKTELKAAESVLQSLLFAVKDFKKSLGITTN